MPNDQRNIRVRHQTKRRPVHLHDVRFSVVQPRPFHSFQGGVFLNSVHFSTGNNDWATPDDLFEKISNDWGPFDLDPCATFETARAECFFQKHGLTEPWHGRVFMNPPYSRGEIDKWVEKAYKESERDSVVHVVALLPARTDTQWFHNWLWLAKEIHFIVGRVRFVGDKIGSAPFPSMIVVFAGDLGLFSDNPKFDGWRQ